MLDPKRPQIDLFDGSSKESFIKKDNKGAWADISRTMLLTISLNMVTTGISKIDISTWYMTDWLLNIMFHW